MNRKEIGNKLLTLRKDKALHQHQVAEHINVSKSTIGAYERGFRVPEDDIKIKLAEYYGVTVGWLFYGEE